MAGYNKRIRALEKRVEEIAAWLDIPLKAGELSENLSVPPSCVSAEEQVIAPLKDWVVPLTHETLTREEVAERCIAAAELKGYKADKDKDFSDFEKHEKCFGGNAIIFETKARSCGYGFYTGIKKGDIPSTLEAFEAYCGVAKPETYEAGFWFEAGTTSLELPDFTSIWFNDDWRKERFFNAKQPHTLTPVNQHTVGRFYLTEGEDPNSYQSYALCVGEGKFVQPTMSNGIVEVLVELFPNQVSLLEVTPAL